MNNPNHEMAIAYVAFKNQLAAAAKVLDEHYKKPLENWLDRFADKEVEIDGVVKLFRPKVEAKKGERIPDGPAIEQGFQDLARKGAFNLAELQNLIEVGALVVGDLEAMKVPVAKKLKVKPEKLETTMADTPAGFKQEFRTTVLAKGKFEGLAGQVTKAVDIEKAIVDHLHRVVTTPAQGTTAIGAKKTV